MFAGGIKRTRMTQTAMGNHALCTRACPFKQRGASGPTAGPVPPPDCSTAGQPVWRPLWFEFPSVEGAFATDDQFLLGPGLLVAPVVKAGGASRPVLLPGPHPWYHAGTGARAPHHRHAPATALHGC